jgi:hypothetical protein
MNERSAADRLPKSSRSPAWTVRPYRPGDESQAICLFEETFGKPLTEAHYRWKIVDSPVIVAAPTVWFAEQQGRIIGQFGGTPMRFKLGPSEHTIVHIGDVMIAPDFQRRGVFTPLYRAVHRAWSGSGIPFAIGLPTSFARPRHHATGWEAVLKIVWMWRPLRPDRLLARRIGLPQAPPLGLSLLGTAWNFGWDGSLRRRSRGVEVVTVERPGDEFDVLWEALGYQYEALVVRDRAWVTYRYAEAPGHGYQLLLARRNGVPVGYLSYRVTRDSERVTGWIADLFTAPGDDAARAALLRRGLVTIAASGAEQVRALMPRNAPVAQAFRRAGFLGGGHGFDVFVLPFASRVPHDVLGDARRWFTMGGDFDVL